MSTASHPLWERLFHWGQEDVEKPGGIRGTSIKCRIKSHVR